MLPLSLAFLAFATPPTDVPWSTSAGSSVVSQFGASSDASWASMMSNNAAFLDMGSWEIHSPPCSATASTVSDDALWAACDGVVHRYELLSGALVEDSEEAWSLGADVLGLWHDGDGLYAMTKGSTGLDEVHRRVDGVVNSGNYPVGVREGLWEGRLTTGRLVLWHGDDDLTTVTLAAGSSVASTAVGGTAFDDLAMSYNGLPYLVSHDTQTVLELVTATNFVVALGGLDGPTSLALNQDLTDPWALLASNAGLEVRDANTGLGAVTATLSPGLGTITDMLVVDGVGLLGHSDGTLAVATARPWVDATVSPSTATEGDQVTVSFTVDTAADWELVLDRTVLDSGTTTAGTVVTSDVLVDDSFVEGATGLWVYATSGLETGHDRVDVFVDAPPPAPTLEVGFADSALVVTLSGIDDADLDHFVVYASETAFDANDFATGGPADFDTDDALELPVAVSGEPGEAVELRLAPLTNGVSYTIGARAVDASGQEGPMSETQTGTPQETFSASELAGETGGVSCSTAPGMGWWFLGGLVGLLGRRRSLVVGGLLASTAASAGNPLCAPGKNADGEGKGDMTPTCADFELRYGSRTVEDESVQAVYGNKAHGILMLEAGPQFFRVVELDLGFGLYRKFDRATSASGGESEVTTMFTLWPVSLGGTLRLQVFDEQLVVPFVRGGFDYIMFGERWDDGAGGKNAVKGAKFGNHYGFGANILLDPFAPGRASLLEAQTGINDTFLTIEYRKTNVKPGEGFDLSGSNVSVGIKLDY
ncbi:MAG: hypothetical protein KC912_07510 [Proteobacteria bacterium]|nr:hypothetical protein [Pseudomonadota bacterium]